MTSTAVDVAAAEVIDARGVLAGWLQRKIDALREINRVQSLSGEKYLDDPDAVMKVPALLRELRDQVAVAHSAVGAQEPRVRSAEAAWLQAYADALSVDVRAAEARLEAHNAKTADLLAALEAHNGTYVTRAELERHLQPEFMRVGAEPEWERPKSEAIERELGDAQALVWTLGKTIEGVDLRRPENLPSMDYSVAYPPLVQGADALVPTVAQRALHDHDPESAHESLREIYRLRGLVEDLEEGVDG